MDAGVGGTVLFCRMPFLTSEHSSVAPLFPHFLANTGRHLCHLRLLGWATEAGLGQNSWLGIAVGKMGIEDCLLEEQGGVII